MTTIDRLNALCDRGWLAQLSGTQLKVWAYLSRRADGRTGDNAYPSLATMAEAIGTTRRRISEALDDLTTLGLIEQTRPATFVAPAVYRVCDPPAREPTTDDSTGDQFGGEETKMDTPPQAGQEGTGSGSAQNGQATGDHFGHPGGAQNGHPTSTYTRTITRETAAQSSSVAASTTATLADDEPTARPPGREGTGSGRGRPVDDSPVVVIYPTVAGRRGGATSWALRQSLVDELRECFPAVDVVGEARAALAWIRADLSRRKTPDGMRRFVTGWLTRATNRGRTARPTNDTNGHHSRMSYGGALPAGREDR